MPPPAGPGAGAASSTMVFHSPQDSQRPPHLLVTAPHDWQTKRFSGLAISAARAWTGTSRRDAASTSRPCRGRRGAGCAPPVVRPDRRAPRSMQPRPRGCARRRKDRSRPSPPSARPGRCRRRSRRSMKPPRVEKLPAVIGSSRRPPSASASSHQPCGAVAPAKATIRSQRPAIGALASPSRTCAVGQAARLRSAMAASGASISMASTRPFKPTRWARMAV